MALFGKKEPEGRTPGVQSLKMNKDNINDKKKVTAKPAPNSKTKGTTNETTYLGKNLKINGNISGRI